MFSTAIRKLVRFVSLESLHNFIWCIMRRLKHLRQQRLVPASPESEAGDLLKSHKFGSWGSLSVSRAANQIQQVAVEVAPLCGHVLRPGRGLGEGVRLIP